MTRSLFIRFGFFVSLFWSKCNRLEKSLAAFVGFFCFVFFLKVQHITLGHNSELAKAGTR